MIRVRVREEDLMKLHVNYFDFHNNWRVTVIVRRLHANCIKNVKIYKKGSIIARTENPTVENDLGALLASCAMV